MIKTVGKDKDHADYSASGSERWLNCPASFNLSKGIPSAASKFSSEGTLAHGCMETVFKNRYELSKIMPKLKRKFGDEMVGHAVEFLRTVLVRSKELRDPIWLIEEKVDSSSFLIPDQFGTLDVALVEEFGKLCVYDFKYGQGILVSPRDSSGRLNSQFAYYALAVSHAYNHNFAEIEIGVYQPRAWSDDGVIFKATTVTVDELLGWIDIFKEGVKATQVPDPAFNAGEWCRFCAAAHVCPEIRDRQLEKARAVFSKKEIKLPAPEKHTLDDLATALEASEKLEFWISRVREHARNHLARGGKIKGYKLVEKRGTRKWIDPVKVEDEGVNKFGTRVYTSPELISPAQMEKKFKSIPGIKEWVDENTHTVSSGLTLVKEHDKRDDVRQNLKPNVSPIEITD